MTKPTNFRRELKNLRKNLQRRKITDKEACEWFQNRGFWVEYNGLGYINWILLRDDIPGRVWSRIGRAAKKKGAFALIGELLFIGTRYSEYQGFHEPPFVKVEKEIKTRTQSWEETRVVAMDGRVLSKTDNYFFKGK